MVHQWVRIENRVSTEYVDGIKEFLNVARQTLNPNGLTLCPCARCLNSRLQNIGDIAAHLSNVGIDKSYTRWVYHGEDEVIEEDEAHDNFLDEEYTGLGAGLEDMNGYSSFNIGPIDDLFGNQQGNTHNSKLREALNNSLYEGCEDFSTLNFVVRLMNIKVMNKWSDNSFEMLLKLMHEVLPHGNNCPTSYYDVRMLLCEAGLGYELIDVCQYDCSIFYGDNKDALTCPVCQSNRYVRNKIPYKKLRYFPITPRLKRLYASRHTAKDMRWHKEMRKDEPGVLRHPADGRAWKHFDELYPDFARDPRSVRLGLASDGFNPFSNMTTTHNTVGETQQDQESGTRPRRGITCGIGARKVMHATKQKLQLEFNFKARRVISAFDSDFMHECGYIVRNNCSLQYKDWRHVPKEVRMPLRHKLTALFEIDLENLDVIKVIDSYMGRAWKGYKSKLHEHFKKIGGVDDPTKAKSTPPPKLNKEDWDYLCDMWCGAKYLEMAEKKIEARQKRKLESRNGSKSTVRYHTERGLDLDSSTGQIETWRLRYWNAEKGWVSTDASSLYEEMMVLRNQHSVESMSDKTIIATVLGRSSVRLNGWGRDPVAPTNNTTQTSNRTTYDDLVDELEALKNKCARMEESLNNIMSTPSSAFGQSQVDRSSDEDINTGEDFNDV